MSSLYGIGGVPFAVIHVNGTKARAAYGIAANGTRQQQRSEYAFLEMKNLQSTATERLLHKARAAMGLTTPYQLAEALKWPRRDVYKYERGEMIMGPSRMIDFSNKTGIPLEEVVMTAAGDEQARKTIPTNG